MSMTALARLVAALVPPRRRPLRDRDRRLDEFRADVQRAARQAGIVAWVVLVFDEERHSWHGGGETRADVESVREVQGWLETALEQRLERYRGETSGIMEQTHPRPSRGPVG
jgi:hypothetical protein